MEIKKTAAFAYIIFITVTLAQHGPEGNSQLLGKDSNVVSEDKGESSGGEQENNRKNAKMSEIVLPDIKSGITIRSKLMQQHVLNRIWNDSILKQSIEAQIAAIENSRKNVVHEDPTPEQVEAQTLYDKGLQILGKPSGDKSSAYVYIQKAAEMNHLNARTEMAWAHVLGHDVDLNIEYAASQFDELAKKGIPEANIGLAFLYSMGIGGKNVSQPLALIHYTLAALGDNTYAQMALGYRYSFGINVPISCEKSLSYYKQVAKKVASKVSFSSGPVIHRVRLLDELENPGSQETELVDYYQLLADKGDVQSQVGLGQLYYQGGKATQQDHQKALEYFTQAANAGNAIGYAFLGKLYLEGSEFIKADNGTAFKFFSKAAELGDPVGQSGLGLMHLHGLGVPKDTIKALTYFTQAADQGWVDGQLQLGTMYFTGNGVKPDYKLAMKYFNLASQSGHVLAYYNLGLMHAYGMGMLRSCPAAVEFFKNVAERGRWSEKLMHAYHDYKSYRMDEAYMQYALLAEMGYEVGQSNSAYLLDRNEITIFNERHEDLIRAFCYWKRAASQGYSAAQVKLGDYYYYGWGTAVDFEAAAALYRKASEQHYNAQAMFNLGYMHEQGLGMKKDWHLAKRLYDLAAETNADAKVPVALALLKLQIIAKIESLKESPYKFVFYLDESVAANWDLYMITILTLLLGFIMYTRRPQQDIQPQPAEHSPLVTDSLLANMPENQNSKHSKVQNLESSTPASPKSNSSQTAAASFVKQSSPKITSLDKASPASVTDGLHSRDYTDKND